MPHLHHGAMESLQSVILLDVILGYCAHADPASVHVPMIREALLKAKRDGRNLRVVISLCGTEGDPQRLSMQRTALEAAGSMVFESNEMAARAAALLMRDVIHQA